MDSAVALVEAYLRVNGYFTVTEYPVVEAMRGSNYREATDLDVLAFRFPGAGRTVPGEKGKGAASHPPFEPDSLLVGSDHDADMIIGEVKQGAAELNASARRRKVLAAALTRFGCCPAADSDALVSDLIREGKSTTPGGHRVRMVAFGATIGSGGDACLKISLGHVLNFLQAYVRDHWPVLRHAHFKDPAFSFLILQEKAARGLSSAPEEGTDE